MKRRQFVASGLALGVCAALPGRVMAAEQVINVYSGSDSNIIDFWSNIVLPAFNKAHPGYSVKVIDAGDNAGLRAIADRAMAALGANADPQVELFEAFDPMIVTDGVAKGLWVDFAKAGLANAGKVNPAAKQSDYDLPYRGSQVLLAYDATKVTAAEAPKSWADLTAWIAANPGQFIYNRPDKGGSGGNFVRRAIHEANGRDPSKFTLTNYSDDYAEKTLTPAWDLLKGLAPNLYEKGAYSSGNTQSVQMLAQGVVSMIPVWSDQVLQAISQGVLPEDTGLVQLSDLALCGGFSRMAVPTNAKQLEGAKLLADFVLSSEMQSAIITELGGFPGVSWDNIDPALREKYKDVIPTTIPTFPSGKWEAAINDGWYRNVAPNVSRG